MAMPENVIPESVTASIVGEPAVGSFVPNPPDGLAQQLIEAPRDNRGFIDWKQLEAAGLRLQFIEQELRSEIDELGHFPTSTELRDSGKEYLIPEMIKGVGFAGWRMRLDADPSRMEPNYWRNEDHRHIWEELQLAIDELGHYPTYGELGESGRANLLSAIAKNGGNALWKEKMGFLPKNKNKGYWNSQNIQGDARKLMLEHKLSDFPSERELRGMGYGPLADAVSSRYPGGFPKFRKDMGFAPKRHPKDYWTNEVIRRETLRIMGEHALDTVPSIGWFKKFGYGPIADAISRSYGGFRLLRQDIKNILQFQVSEQLSGDTLSAVFN